MNLLEKLNPQTLVQAFNPLSKSAKVLGVASSIFAYLNSTKKKTAPESGDDFSLSRFTENLKGDGFRLSKGYYYNVLMFFHDMDDSFKGVDRALTFQCQEATLPGWQVKTEQGKIYSLPYDVAIGLQQDPIWLAFNVDIKHKIEDFFMTNRKLKMIDDVSYSPHYKDSYQFYMMIQVTDENFVPINAYVMHNCLIRTVQNISYGAEMTEHVKTKVEITYEYIRVVDYVSEARALAKANPDARNPNQLRIGPFTADISLVNQTLGVVSKIPGWFKGPTKI